MHEYEVNACPKLNYQSRLFRAKNLKDCRFIIDLLMVMLRTLIRESGGISVHADDGYEYIDRSISSKTKGIG